MKKLKIEGGHSLQGKICLPGAKNSVLPIMAASLLCDGVVHLQNVPDLTDVHAGAEILTSLGSETTYASKEMIIERNGIKKSGLSRGQMQSMRSSIFYMAPLLARTGRAEIFHPGGCNLGARPIDMHLQSLAAMGAVYQKVGDSYVIEAPQGLTGTEIHLRIPSVGTTETVLMAAVLAQGKTVLHGAAREPEIVDLAGFLNACGADITGAGGPVVTIQPVKKLTGGVYRIMGDRMLASTLLCALAAVGGELLVEDIQYSSIAKLVNILRLAGCRVESVGQNVHAVANAPLAGSFEVETKPFPGFATDAGPLLCAAFCHGGAQLALHETIFDNRYTCVAEMRKLGADIEVNGRKVTVHGREALQGAQMAAADLRGGAALIIAALGAQGESVIENMRFVDRGYEDFGAMLTALKAKASYI
ncbi:UDP-N-acetylglucosamine 1-carboxyvinyltransferase [Ruminococcaceae bacterium OttesenSCG-928-N02]|nr:UDP-N-acetylglucosamine 1-carboxyvinyltransferase [Ruminococcaceae bacterium OttesenSCG-928-N02]